jgi:hypothetical protein
VFQTTKAREIRRLIGAADSLAWIEGGHGALPNLHQATVDGSLVYGTQVLSNGVGSWRDVDAASVGGTTNRDSASGIVKRFTGTYDYARSIGFVGGFPNLRQSTDGAGRLCGVFLLDSSEVEWRDVPRAELGNLRHRRGTARGLVERFNAAYDYALREGFAGGFPNLHEKTHSNGVSTHGVLLFRKGAVEWRDIEAEELEFAGHIDTAYRFDAGIPGADRRAALRQHLRGWTRYRNCTTLTPSQRKRLGEVYSRRLQHSPTRRSGVFALVSSANDSRLWVNFDALRMAGTDELGQTLIHELMHLAGYMHPPRRSCAGGLAPPECDVPGDGGVYYSTPPLQAELCIAGSQSDMACWDDDGSCLVGPPDR